MAKFITVLDLGSNKITACAAAINKDGEVSLLSLESLASRGIEGGDITDINRAVEDISAVMGKLSRADGKKIKGVFVLTRGSDIEMAISRGMIPLSKTPREITKNDIEKCLEIATMVKLPLNRVILEKITRGFHIDGGASSIKNPIGLYGIKLETETFIATANLSKLQSIHKCVDQAGFFLEGIHHSGIASSNVILDDAERKKGALLLDMGNSLTEGIVFKDSALNSYHVIKKGASSVLDGQRRISRERLDVLLGDILEALQRERENFSSVVITGGGALIDGLIEETEKMFSVPTRIGLAKIKNRSLNTQDAIIHTSTIGLVKHLARNYKSRHFSVNPLRKILHKAVDIYESYF